MLGLIKKNHYYKRPVQKKTNLIPILKHAFVGTKSILKKKDVKHFVLNKENTKNCI